MLQKKRKAKLYICIFMRITVDKAGGGAGAGVALCVPQTRLPTCGSILATCQFVASQNVFNNKIIYICQTSTLIISYHRLSVPIRVYNNSYIISADPGGGRRVFKVRLRG